MEEEEALLPLSPKPDRIVMDVTAPLLSFSMPRIAPTLMSEREPEVWPDAWPEEPEEDCREPRSIFLITLESETVIVVVSPESVIEPPVPREAFFPDEFCEPGFPDPEGGFLRLPEAAPLPSQEEAPCFLCPVPFPKPRSIVPRASVILEPSTAVTFPKISFFAEEEPDSAEAA